MQLCGLLEPRLLPSQGFALRQPAFVGKTEKV
jgi:hypothetical protein